MKKILIISPHFIPVNAADMHRVRQSLPYFEANGWKPIVLSVNPEYIEMETDDLLRKSVPQDIEIHQVKAFSTRYTRKLGLGNLGIRAFFQLYLKGNELLKTNKFDLIYFSTTVFACMPLGRIWKQKFKVPFVLDMQDPWRNDYYLSVHKSERPAKFWFSYRLDKYLEAYTIPKVDGLLSVSEGYITKLKERYKSIENIPEKVLTFGAGAIDFEVVERFVSVDFFKNYKENINVVYIGRGGHDMKDSLTVLFKTLKNGFDENPEFKKLKFWFIGTSYAANGKGDQTILPLAKQLGVGHCVVEITDRKPYFEAMSILKQSDFIVMPGSNDKDYTASKLYPNVLAKKPMLCIFHSNSSVIEIVKNINAGEIVKFDEKKAEEVCFQALKNILSKIPYEPETNWANFAPFTAENRTKEQCDFFNIVLNLNK